MLSPILRKFRVALASLCMMLATVSLTGCQAPMVFTVPAAEWQTLQGQMHYTGAGGRSVVGDVIIRRSPDGGEFRLQFSSGPGFPLAKISTSGEAALAEGALVRGRWQGKLAAAPARVKPWVDLREVFAQAAPGRSELRGPGWSATASYGGGTLRECQILSADRTTFAFHFGQ